MGVFERIENWHSLGRKVIVPLIDPDRYDPSLPDILAQKIKSVPIVFVGGSIVTADTEGVVSDLKAKLGHDTHVVIFPGDYRQVSQNADAVLFLSLLSGRNPEYLIGQQVKSAPIIRRMGVEAIPTAYLLIDGGRQTSVQYVSNTQPLPADKPDLSVATALAAEMLGFRLIYLEAGSGAERPVDASIISAVRDAVGLPIIVGGGLRSAKSVSDAFTAGADIVVVGTAFERNAEATQEILQLM